GRLRAGARGTDRDTRRRDGHSPHASRRAALIGHAGRLARPRAQGRRAQRSAPQTAARGGGVRKAVPARHHHVGEEEVSRPVRPVWRSILYVPGNVPRFIDKAHERGADCVLVDLEDSVTLAEKPKARALLPETMKKVAANGADVAVRINRPLRLAIA